MLTLDHLRFLQSAAGADLLAELRTANLAERNTLQLLTALRKRYSPDQAAAALETARLRVKAREKFPDSDNLFFTPDALEQATHHAVGSFHRQLLPVNEPIADLGCGIGADTLWLSGERWMIALDRDPLRLAMAQANVEALGRGPAHFLQANLTDPLPFMGIRDAFFDPARRTESRRIFSVRDYSPPLEVIKTWNFGRLLVKLSPGVNLAELNEYPGQIYFVSLDGELKEALLLYSAGERRQVHAALVESNNHTTSVQLLFSTNLPAPPLRDPAGYLYEPDPAVIRAGLLGEMAQALHLEMYRLDDSIAYLTADTRKESVLARTWPIEDWMAFNLKRLRAYLREHGIGRVTVKKRGSPISPESLIAQLKLPPGDEERVVVLTHVKGQPAVLICGAPGGPSPASAH